MQILAVQSRCKHSLAEILGTEKIILDKLQWDLYTATPMDFLNIVSTTFCIFFFFKETTPYQIRLKNTDVHTHTHSSFPRCLANYLLLPICKSFKEYYSNFLFKFIFKIFYYLKPSILLKKIYSHL